MKKLIIGITGSIAAFKTVQFISDLVKEKYEIEVMLTPSAAKFVTPTSISALTKKKTYIDVFDDDPGCITHVDIVKDADLFMIVPASATTIAKCANGIADNMLTAAFLAATCPKLIAPAMNVHMYENKATQRNIQTLKDDGVLFVEPAVGLLACGDTGKGKLADYDHLHLMMEYALSDHPLQGKKVLVTAGPTQEALDPVRFLTNHSSGKMGYSIARAAFILGAKVRLIHGPTSLKPVPYIINQSITSAQDLFECVKRHHTHYDYIIMSAAVADYTPVETSTDKIKKNDNELILKLKKNPDILDYIGHHQVEHQVICGFAMETQDLIENASKKLNKKQCDLIIANHLKTEGAGFQGDTNVVTIITQDSMKDIDKMFKSDLSYIILKECMKIGAKK